MSKPKAIQVTIKSLDNDDLERLYTAQERIGTDLAALTHPNTWDLEERREALKGIVETAREILEIAEGAEIKE